MASMKMPIAAALLVALAGACQRGSEGASTRDSLSRRPATGQPAQAGVPSANDTFPMRASEILALLRRVGADSVVRMYFLNPRVTPDCWPAFLDSISTGDSLWLVVADSLAPGTDACSAEGLDDAVSSALEHAPKRILDRSLATSPFFDYVCENHSEDEELACPNPRLPDYLKRRIQAVGSIPGREYVKLRDACAARLAELPCCAGSASTCAVDMPSVPTGDIVADSVIGILAARGPEAGLEKMAPGGELQEAYRARIASGDPRWLAIAGVVATAADGAWSIRHGRRVPWVYDDLIVAVQDALPLAPQEVLEAIVRHPKLMLYGVCSTSPVYGEHLDSVAAEPRRARAVAALKALQVPEYARLRDACLLGFGKLAS